MFCRHVSMSHISLFRILETVRVYSIMLTGYSVEFYLMTRHFGDLAYAVWCVHFLHSHSCSFTLYHRSMPVSSQYKHEIYCWSLPRLHILLVYVTLHLSDVCRSDMIIIYYSLCCESQIVSLSKYCKGPKLLLMCDNSYFIWYNTAMWVLQYTHYFPPQPCGQRAKNAGSPFAFYVTSLISRIPTQVLVISNFGNHSLR